VTFTASPPQSLELYETYLRGYGSAKWYLDILRSAWAEWLEYREDVSKS
jgi:hypothetical protein